MSFIEPPFVFTGSKYKLLSQLLPLFDRSKHKFVDLFAGGASVYSNVIRDYDSILANDIIGDLMKIQYNLLFDHSATMERLMAIKLNKDDAEGYAALRENYNQNPTPEKLFMLMLCCTNNMMRFNRSFRFNQTHGRRTLNDNTLYKIKNWVDHVEPHKGKLRFSEQPFSKIEITANTFYYADPPYDVAEAGYNAFWDRGDDDRLLDYLLAINNAGGTFCLSGIEYHDGRVSPLLTKMEECGFTKISINSEYNKVSRRGNKHTQEVVFINYQPGVH